MTFLLLFLSRKKEEDWSVKQSFLNNQTFQKHTCSTLLWLKKSIDVTGQKGSSAFYSRIRLPFRGWERAYPETTGYIIETLLDYHQILKEDWLFEYAVKCADWLCEIQLKNGAFAGLFGETKEPSTFNTGQIIFGLVRAFEATKNEKYFRAFERATNWLSDNLESNGSWQKGAYVPGFVPSYYTRVVWAMLFANPHLNNPTIEKNGGKALDFYVQKIQPNGAVKDWSFESGKPAFTHTIAYTIRGFLESAVLLGDDLVLEKTIQIAEKLAEIWNPRFWAATSSSPPKLSRQNSGVNSKLPPENRFAGTYDENWKGDYSFICVVGNAQLSVVFSRFFEVTGEEKWRELAREVLVDLERRMGKSRRAPWQDGKIPGSVPFYGKYMRFKYPNWAAKFYLDAWAFLLKT